MCSFSFMEQKEGGSAKVTTKVFTFEDKNTKESLTVSIPEVLDPQYGMYVWPCAVVMAQYLWTHRDDLTGRTVLELGAGVSLPGVLAALCGAQVILTDSLDKPLCLENCKRSCDTNGLQNITVLGLSWGEVSPDLLLLPKLDIILGSDVFYDPVDFEDILVTFVCLLRKNPKAQFWTTYQVRWYCCCLTPSFSLWVESVHLTLCFGFFCFYYSLGLALTGLSRCCSAGGT
uniref:Methyltransferase 23, arginine n=1 Tax=Nothobranchius furzeri TaxID=105023 RepID=A0A8C6NWM0_NOTFU